MIHEPIQRASAQSPMKTHPSPTYLQPAGRLLPMTKLQVGVRAIFPHTYVDMQQSGQPRSVQAVLLKAHFLSIFLFFSQSFNFLPQHFLHFSFLQTSGNRLKLISSDASKSAGLAALQNAFRCHFGIKIYQLCRPPPPIVCRRDLGEGLCLRLDRFEMQV